MSFENLMLVDEYGNEYNTSNFYASQEGEYKVIEFKGKIEEDISKLIFKADGMYYTPKNERFITIDLKNKKVEPNIYGLELIMVNEDTLVVGSNSVRNIAFSDVIDENGNIKVSTISTSTNGGEIGESLPDGSMLVENTFNLNDVTEEKITLEVSWVLKDITEPISVDIIKK